MRTQRTGDFRVEQVVGAQVGTGAAHREDLFGAERFGTEFVEEVLQAHQRLGVGESAGHGGDAVARRRLQGLGHRYQCVLPFDAHLLTVTSWFLTSIAVDFEENLFRRHNYIAYHSFKKIYSWFQYICCWPFLVTFKLSHEVVHGDKKINFVVQNRKSKPVKVYENDKS